MTIESASAVSNTHRTIHPHVLYVGTPVMLVGTRNPDGSTNLAPASSHFSLGPLVVLGLEEGGQSIDNVRRHGELTVNFPSAPQWAHVERLAAVTGRDPVPLDKQPDYTFEAEKFRRAGLTPAPGELVAVDRVAEAPLQVEARVRRITAGVGVGEENASLYSMVEAEVVRVHALREITIEGTDYIDPESWHPLIYSFRHFFDRGEEVGWTRKSRLAETPERVARWESFGGTWRVVSVSSEHAVVELLRCDGGEIVETVESEDPYFVRWATVQEAAESPATSRSVEPLKNFRSR